MTEYLWIRPLKAVETIQGDDEEFDKAEKRLWQAIASGIVEVQLNGVAVPEAHIMIYLRLYARLDPEVSPYTLPPDVLVHLPSLRAAFQGVRPAKQRVGRPTKVHRPADNDRLLVHEMHRRISKGEAKSRADAAWQLENEGQIAKRNDLPDSRVKRLTRLFAVIYSG